MITAIKRTLTTGQDGGIHLFEPALHPGMQVKVIVLISSDIPFPPPAPNSLLDTLDRLSVNAPPMPEDYSERFEEYL